MKRKVILVSLMVITILLVGCNKEVKEDSINKITDKESMINMANDINKKMYGFKNMAELEEEFSMYKDKIADPLYINNFNTNERDVALIYYLSDGSYTDYELIENIVVDRDKGGVLTTDIYVIYKVKIEYIDEDEGDLDGYIDINGANKYTYSGDTLIELKRLLDH